MCAVRMDVCVCVCVRARVSETARNARHTGTCYLIMYAGQSPGHTHTHTHQTFKGVVSAFLLLPTHPRSSMHACLRVCFADSRTPPTKKAIRQHAHSHYRRTEVPSTDIYLYFKKKQTPHTPPPNFLLNPLTVLPPLSYLTHTLSLFLFPPVHASPLFLPHPVRQLRFPCCVVFLFFPVFLWTVLWLCVGGGGVKRWRKPCK